MSWIKESWYIDGSEGLVDKFLNKETGKNLIDRIAFVISKRPGRDRMCTENWILAESLAKYGLLRQLARKAGRFQLPESKEET